MKILLHGLNYAPEEMGIGKYSGEMVDFLVNAGHQVTVVTTPPYYPQWRVWPGFKAWKYQSSHTQSENGGQLKVVRCPLWVPKKVSGLKRIIHLASFGLSSTPSVLWNSVFGRPDVVMTVEPAAFCMPTTWLAARLSGAKCWLHVQDFEVDAAFELGILKQPLLKRAVLAVESFLMRRFDRVSSISPRMVDKLNSKKVAAHRSLLFPNWVDCEVMKPLESATRLRDQFGIPRDKCVALYAGNIGAKQGLEILIDAAKMAQDNPNLHFVICGTGARAAEYQQQSAGVENIQWLPPQPLEKFNQLMNCADIHLLPQKSGAADLVMPSKLTGMLATGRPVVTGADPGTQIANVVADHGVVVPPGQSEPFHDAIVQLANDAAWRQELGQAARAYAEQFLGRVSLLQQFESRLKQLVGEQPVPDPVATVAQPHVRMSQVQQGQEEWQKQL